MPPIKPTDVTLLKTAIIPEGVFEAFNDMIVKHWNGRCATFNVKDVAMLAAKKMDCSSTAVYEQKWLDVEPSYREAGWKVEYDHESYPATFTFST
jgi:hypothetical protein